MRLQLGGVIGRAFSLTWRHRWLWLLGLVGGGAGFSGNIGNTSNFGNRPGTATGIDVVRSQARAFLEQDFWLVIAGVGLLVVVGVLVFLLYSVCVPASIWGTLSLDAGRPVRLGDAWRYGRSRFADFVRLGLLRFAIGLPGLVVLTVASINLGHAFLYGTNDDLPSAFVLLGLSVIPVALVSLAAFVVLAWSERTMVILNLGALDGIRSGWWLLRHSLGDTLLFAVCMWAVLVGVSIVTTIGVVLLALPGGILLAVGLLSHSAGVAVVGGAVLALLTIPAALVAAGYGGSLVQAAYALAARDLCISHRLEVVPGLLAPAPA